MKKIFHFDSSSERYECDAAVVWCFDNRFDLTFRKFLKHQHVQYSDDIKVAGGAKCLASPSQHPDREFVLDQIRISIRLHNTKRVILMLHSDCGAYGGLDAFHGDTQAEADHHRDELKLAKANLITAIPNIQVDAYFVNFEGVWEPKL